MRATDTETLIRALADRTARVRPLARPWVRAAAWLAIAVPSALLVVVMMSMHGDWVSRLLLPRVVSEEAFALATGVLAAIAAFASVVPGYSRKVLFLPVVPLALWLGGLGQSSVRDWLQLTSQGFSMQSEWVCLPATIMAGADAGDRDGRDAATRCALNAASLCAAWWSGCGWAGQSRSLRDTSCVRQCAGAGLARQHRRAAHDDHGQRGQAGTELAVARRADETSRDGSASMRGARKLKGAYFLRDRREERFVDHHLLLGDSLTAGQPHSKGGGCAEAGRRDVHESPEGFAGEVHWPDVRCTKNPLVLVSGDAHHQVTADDAAAHAALEQERETAEHLSFNDPSPCADYLSDAIREHVVVRH